MRPLRFEWSKFVGRKSSWVLILINAILFPLVVGAVAFLNMTEDNVPIQAMPGNIAYGIIAYSQLYIFLPVWIIVFPGLELSGGHASRVIFLTSRWFYLSSKIYFCALISLMYTILGLLTLLIAGYSLSGLVISAEFVIFFVVQSILSNFVFSVLLLCIVLLVRSTIMSFVVYLVLNYIEGLIFVLVDKLWGLKLNGLPFHLVRSFYVRNGESGLINYYNPIFEDWTVLLISGVALIIAWILVCRIFLKSDLPPLSD